MRANLLALFLLCAVPFLILAYISCKKNNVYLPDILYDVLQAHLFSSSPSGFFLICRFQIWERAHSIYLGLVYFASYDDPWFHQFSCKWWFFFLHDKAILCFCLSLCVCMCPCVCGCVYPWMLHYTFFIHSSITWLTSYLAVADAIAINMSMDIYWTAARSLDFK